MNNSTDNMRKLMESATELFNGVAVDEGFTSSHNGELEKKFDVLEDRFITMRRKLGIINKADRLTPEEKKEYASKTMSVINAVRSELLRTMKALGMSEKEIAHHRERIGLDREFGKPSEVFTNPSYDSNRGAKPAPAAAPAPEPQPAQPPAKVDWYTKFKDIFSKASADGILKRAA